MLSSFLSLIVSGLAIGAIYSLAAIGFSLLWQTSRTINFAQGDFVMLPAFVVLALLGVGVPFWISCIVSVLFAVVVLGYLFKRTLVETLQSDDVLPLVVATMALGVFLRQSVKNLYGAQAYAFPSIVPDVTYHLGSFAFSSRDIAILVLAGLAVYILHLFTDKTRTGRAMQAAAQEPAVATILGIPVQRMVLYTFLINGALVALASFLITPVFLAKFSNGETLGIFAFVAAIIGGFNRVRGALVGGLLIGVIETLTSAYVSTEYRNAVPLILLIVIIMFRPQGLLGSGEERTV